MYDERLAARWDNAIQEIAGAEPGIIRKVAASEKEEFFFSPPDLEGALYLESGDYQLQVHDKVSRRAIRICGKGDLVGYGSWLVPKKTYSLLCLTEGAMTFIARPSIAHLQSAYPRFNDVLMESLCRIILSKDSRILALENTTARARVRMLLISLTLKFGEPSDNGIRLRTQVSKAALAQLSNVTAESLSRILTDFEKEKVVVRHKREIYVTDLEALKRET
jgi:CRP-like cAMP-binding protein